MIRRLVFGSCSSALVAAGGWKAGSLQSNGAIAATLVGSAVCAGTSWPGALCLGTFFVSSSRLSKSRRLPDVAARGSRRDAVQVLANGGVAALSALVARRNPGLALTVVAGSLAAATADTWATEIGSSSGALPRQIISRKQVQPGESGGVTAPGTVASAGGALLIAGTAGVAGRVWIGSRMPTGLSGAVFLAGITGSLVDSVTGELVQERRYCEHCDVMTEKAVHGCGHPAVHVAGVRWITNDVVNVLCTASGALAALCFYRLWR